MGFRFSLRYLFTIVTLVALSIPLGRGFWFTSGLWQVFYALGMVVVMTLLLALLLNLFDRGPNDPV